MQLSSNGYQTSEAEKESDCISYAKQESINDCFQLRPSCSYLLFNLGSSPPRSQLLASPHESHHRACESQKPSLDLSNRLVFPIRCCSVRHFRRLHYQKNHVSFLVAAITTTVLLGNHPPSPSFFFFSPELPTPTVQHGEGVFWENREESKEREEKEKEGRKRREEKGEGMEGRKLTADSL